MAESFGLVTNIRMTNSQNRLCSAIGGSCPRRFCRASCRWSSARALRRFWLAKTPGVQPHACTPPRKSGRHAHQHGHRRSEWPWLLPTRTPQKRGQGQRSICAASSPAAPKPRSIICLNARAGPALPGQQQRRTGEYEMPAIRFEKRHEAGERARRGRASRSVGMQSFQHFRRNQGICETRINSSRHPARFGAWRALTVFPIKE